MKAFIPLLLYCAASLTNVGLIEARKNGIVYYARGWYGGNPFSYSAGSEGSIWPSPSATAPLAPAYADDLENLSVSMLAAQGYPQDRVPISSTLPNTLAIQHLEHLELLAAMWNLPTPVESMNTQEVSRIVAQEHLCIEAVTTLLTLWEYNILVLPEECQDRLQP
ncbi:hypothetical protein MTO96_041618 [Rhipicephalus appendiculatus]